MNAGDLLLFALLAMMITGSFGPLIIRFQYYAMNTS